MAIAQLNSALQVDNVQVVQVSAVIYDSVNGVYTRVIQVYDQPIDQSVRPVIEIRITGTTAIQVELTTPQLTF